MSTNVKPELPSESEATLARESSRLLSFFLSTKDEAQSIRVIDQTGEHEPVKIPTTAYRLLINILSEMAQGNAVSLIPVHAELTTQEAADILNVSRPFLIKLLDERMIPFHKVGTHRRVRYRDLIDYKSKIDQERGKALDERIYTLQFCHQTTSRPVIVMSQTLFRTSRETACAQEQTKSVCPMH